MKTENIKIQPEWKKAKDEIWNDTFADLEDEQEIKKISLFRKSVLYYAAASVAVLFTIISGTCFFYTKSEIVERGQHLSVVLPDGSKVDMNAESSLKYKPLWWYISRNVELTGEAFFEVEKGSTFNVHFGKYKVSVLGTSFNVYSRADKFNVTCLSGKVKVSDHKQSVSLTSNMMSLLDNGQLKTTTSLIGANESISWIQGKFIFVGVPLNDVIQEIERQYDITITSKSNLDYLYSGNFIKTNNPKEILEIVGKPFGIEFEIE